MHPQEVRNEARLEDFLECEVARSNDASEDPEPTAEVLTAIPVLRGNRPLTESYEIIEPPATQ
jgi:hypothetical protein